MYYAWPGLSTLSFEGFDGDGGALSATIRVRSAAARLEDEADADLLAAQVFPFRLMPLGGLRR